MKNQYFGDVGDYGKYGLLRYFAKNGISIFINWYLTQDDGTNDGKHTKYLDKVNLYEKYDDELFAILYRMLKSEPEIRDVEAFETENAIPGATYYHEVLNMKALSSATERKAHRDKWHNDAIKASKDATLVFADPDNGIVRKPRSLKTAEKYVYADEVVDYYKSGKDVVYYCHKGRRKDQPWEEYKLLLKEQLPDAKLMAVTFHRGTQRSYIFICHTERAQKYRDLLREFVANWIDVFTEEPTEGYQRIFAS